MFLLQHERHAVLAHLPGAISPHRTKEEYARHVHEILLGIMLAALFTIIIEATFLYVQIRTRHWLADRQAHARRYRTQRLQHTILTNQCPEAHENPCLMHGEHSDEGNTRHTDTDTVYTYAGSEFTLDAHRSSAL